VDALAASGAFDLRGTPHWQRVQSSGSFGRSTHADRSRDDPRRRRAYGVVVDPHTADGLKVGREHRDPPCRSCASRRRCR
jgi:threonine synthase